MADTVIKAENISKAYRLGEISTGTLSHDLNRWWSKVRGKEDPFLKIGETNDRTTKSKSDVVWSLKDVNFDIKQGDAVGIIGRNGAGKSTLLKILSRVTTPTTGLMKAHGRIASLLEVGTGFHPELTGRENIFLNGAILGMRKKEIARKFDEIVDFSGVERYIDTPVKRYSSGMYVRLAFAVAAYLESEILIVDEVLAVGDAEFQKKCLGKMGDVSRGEGRTVLFVSHSMSSIRSLCNKAIVLNKGQSSEVFTADEGIKLYFKSIKDTSNHHYSSRNNDIDKSQIHEVFLTDENGSILSSISKNTISAYLNFVVFLKRDNYANLGTTIFNSEGVPLLSSSVLDTMDNMQLGSYTYRIKLPIELLKGDEYTVEAAFWDNEGTLDSNEGYIRFEVEKRSKLEILGVGVRGAFLNPNLWTATKFINA